MEAVISNMSLISAQRVWCSPLLLDDEYSSFVPISDDENYENVMQALKEGNDEEIPVPDRQLIRRLSFTPGTLVFFCGRYPFYCVLLFHIELI